jgi:hypothetical protein
MGMPAINISATAKTAKTRKNKKAKQNKKTKQKTQNRCYYPTRTGPVSCQAPLRSLASTSLRSNFFFRFFFSSQNRGGTRNSNFAPANHWDHFEGLSGAFQKPPREFLA